MINEFQGKKLLLLGGLYLSCDIVKYAQKMGVHVVVADYDKDSPAKKIADESVLIDATDTDKIIQYCRESKIDGVITGYVDILLPTYYKVCKELELPCYITQKMMSMSLNKMDFKETCMKYNIPVPKTYFVGKDVPNDIYENINYPVFVKPLDASGSRGAGVCYNKKEVKQQYLEAIKYSPSKNVIIEDYITGKEFLLDYVAVDGEFRLLSMFDRYMCDDRGSARNYANISVAPSKTIDNYLKNMNQNVISMFKDLGFTDGLIFLQGHTDGDKIIFYEMGCRLGGSFYQLDEKCIGYNPVKMLIRYSLSGRMVDDIEKISSEISKFDKYAFSYNCLLGGDEEEMVCSISGLDEMKKLSSYLISFQHKYIGDNYKKDSIIDKPLITIYLVNSDFEKAKKDISHLNSEIEAYNQYGKPLLMNRFDPEKL